MCAQGKVISLVSVCIHCKGMPIAMPSLHPSILYYVYGNATDMHKLYVGEGIEEGVLSTGILTFITLHESYYRVWVWSSPSLPSLLKCTLAISGNSRQRANSAWSHICSFSVVFLKGRCHVDTDPPYSLMHVVKSSLWCCSCVQCSSKAQPEDAIQHTDFHLCLSFTATSILCIFVFLSDL